MKSFDYYFEWDPIKAARNVGKHEISFENATEVFTDPMALTLFDVEHSEEEERWITIGQTLNQQLLVVVHTFSEREGAATVEVISARKATKRESKDYEG